MKKFLILSISILIIIGIGIFILINKDEKDSTTNNNDISNSSNTSDDENKKKDTLTLEEVLAAPETDASQFSWRPTDEGVYLRSCSSEDEIIVVPKEADGQPVIGVDANALNYLDCRALVFPDSVTKMDNGSIGILDNLEVLVYGAGIKDSITIPTSTLPALRILAVKEGAKKIPLVLAAGANNLEKVYLPESLEVESLSNGDIILDCGDPTFIVNPGSAAEQYAINNGYKYEYK